MKFLPLKLLYAFLILATFSCVSPQQYEALLKENEFLEEENNVLREEVAFSEEGDLVETKLESDVIRLERELTESKQRYATLEKTYLNLSSKYNLIINDKGRTSNYTGAELDYKVEVQNMKRTLEEQTKAMRMLELTLQQKETHIKDLERLMHNQQFSN